MTRLFLVALINGVLCFSGANCGATKVQDPQSSDRKAESEPTPTLVTLTPEHSTNSFPVKASDLSSDSEVLEVVVTRVINPSRTAVVIVVSLSNIAPGKSEPEKTLIGNFSLYPADKPGTFLLNPKPALNKLSTEKPTNSANVRLLVELKRLDESTPWTPVEVTMTQPRWRTREK